MTNLDSILKKQRHYFVKKGLSSQGYGFSSSHVWMWELDYKKSSVPWNQCFWTWYWRRLLRVPFTAVSPKGNHSWIFIGRTDAEAETPILWQPDVKSWLIWKDPDAGKDWRQEEKGMTEDEMVRRHHRLNEHEFWVNSGNWWWTGRPGMLQLMESQRVEHDWETELNWTEGDERPVLLQPTQQVGIESGWCIVWEKETSDRIKVLNMCPGDSTPLESRALFLAVTSLLFSVLASRKYLLCYDEVIFLCPQSQKELRASSS